MTSLGRQAPSLEVPTVGLNSIRGPALTFDFRFYINILPHVLGILRNRQQRKNRADCEVPSVKRYPLDSQFRYSLKRIFDIAVSLTLLVFIFVWLWPMIILAIKLESKGPILYKQEREGQKNKRFLCLKFRSMIHNSKQFDKKGSFLQVSENDFRVTRVGKFLRRRNFDELPQFLCIFRGDMSLVGPRPHPTVLNLEYQGKIRDYSSRHRIKPGMTGWAQIRGLRGKVKNVAHMRKRIEHDLWYIENWSFWLDVKIIFRSLVLMINGDPKAY
jgi:putative colanic acid biosynthesis UDP-glucose lipid carrier transferase